MRVLYGYLDPNTRICGSTRIYAGMLGALLSFSCFTFILELIPEYTWLGGRINWQSPRLGLNLIFLSLPFHAKYRIQDIFQVLSVGRSVPLRTFCTCYGAYTSPMEIPDQVKFHQSVGELKLSAPLLQLLFLNGRCHVLVVLAFLHLLAHLEQCHSLQGTGPSETGDACHNVTVKANLACFILGSVALQGLIRVPHSGLEQVPKNQFALGCCISNT